MSVAEATGRIVKRQPVVWVTVSVGITQPVGQGRQLLVTTWVGVVGQQLVLVGSVLNPPKEPTHGTCAPCVFFWGGKKHTCRGPGWW